MYLDPVPQKKSIPLHLKESQSESQSETAKQSNKEKKKKNLRHKYNFQKSFFFVTIVDLVIASNISKIILTFLTANMAWP